MFRVIHLHGFCANEEMSRRFLSRWREMAEKNALKFSLSFLKQCKSLVQVFVKFSGKLRIRVKYFCFIFFCPIETVSGKVVTVRYLIHSLIARY